MCHLVLMMPILGLAVFWFWPISVALPIYTIILLLSAVVYFVLMQAMRHPVATGSEGLINEIGEAMQAFNQQTRVFVHGEIWNAISSEPLHQGESVKIAGVNGLSVRVKRVKVTP